MGDRNRDDAGRYTEAHPDSTFLKAIRESDLPTAGDIADVVGCPYTTALDRLKSLEADGLVTSREIGASYVWEIADPD